MYFISTNLVAKTQNDQASGIAYNSKILDIFFLYFRTSALSIIFIQITHYDKLYRINFNKTITYFPTPE